MSAPVMVSESDTKHYGNALLHNLIQQAVFTQCTAFKWLILCTIVKVLFVSRYISYNSKEMSCLVLNVSVAYYTYCILHLILIYWSLILKKTWWQQTTMYFSHQLKFSFFFNLMNNSVISIPKYSDTAKSLGTRVCLFSIYKLVPHRVTTGFN